MEKYNAENKIHDLIETLTQEIKVIEDTLQEKKRFVSSLYNVLDDLQRTIK